MSKRLPIRLRLGLHWLSREGKPLTRAAQVEETLLCHLIIAALRDRPYPTFFAERLRLAGLSPKAKRAWYAAACDHASPEVRPYLSNETLRRLLEVTPEHLPLLRQLVDEYGGDDD